MALLSTEFRSGGEVRDPDGRMVVVMDRTSTGLLTGEIRSGGQVRDADGRRVVKVA